MLVTIEAGWQCVAIVKRNFEKRSEVHKIAISGLAAAAALRGGAAAPAVAMAQPVYTRSR